jgi:membrane protease YdiL (CAAX protease family)
MAEPMGNAATEPAGFPIAAKRRVWHLFVLFLVSQAAILFSSAVAIGFAAAARGRGRASSPAEQADLFREIGTSPEIIVASIICGVVVCTGLALLVGALSPRPFVERMRLGRSRLSALELAVASLGFLALSSGSDALLRLLPGYGHSAIAVLNRFFEGRSGADLWLTIALVGVAAPVGEELFYRGALQTRFAERFGRGAGLTLASLAFGLAHFEPIHVLFAVVAGFYLGWVSDLAASCRASLVVHAVNNAAATLAAVSMASGENVSTSAPAAVTSGLVVVASTFWLRRRVRDRVAPAASSP